MKRFKLGFGPMSTEIVDILCEYTQEKDYPLMIIASRNQVDADTGYVTTSANLAEQVNHYDRKNILLCRDHCGPYFADLDKGIDLEAALLRCESTIAADIAAGFDLIHIDVSRIPGDQLAHAKRLIDFTLNLEPKMKLEFGSEDNTGIDVEGSNDRMAEQLEFLAQYKDNVVFVVSQTGSLTKDGQMGKFTVASNKKLAKQIHAAGFLFKEHNADYFTEKDIEQRIAAGIDSINIAPQLGKIQTDLLTEFAGDTPEYTIFADYVYSQPYWPRWMSKGSTDKATAVSVAGHYSFASKEYNDAMGSINRADFNAALKDKIYTLLDMYRTFDKE